MNDNCPVCKAPITYLDEEKEMECVLCHKKEMSRTACEKGHYVCGDCHEKGMDSVISLCLSEKSKDPSEIAEKMMRMPFCHMHGPEHHVIVGSALLTAYKNAGGDIDLFGALCEMQKRGRKVPAGVCGFWGACGAAVSSGIFVSIITKSAPLANEEWGLSNLMTSESLAAIGKIGGPRCCKRDSRLAIETAVDFAEKNFGIKMEKHEIICEFFEKNNQCIKTRCPFYPFNK